MGQRSAARIGGSAVGGAIIGAIFGGGKGAAIGAAAGAGAGTAATMATQKSQATLHAGSTVTVRLTNPTTVTRRARKLSAASNGGHRVCVHPSANFASLALSAPIATRPHRKRLFSVPGHVSLHQFDSPEPVSRAEST